MEAATLCVFSQLLLSKWHQGKYVVYFAMISPDTLLGFVFLHTDRERNKYKEKEIFKSEC